MQQFLTGTTFTAHHQEASEVHRHERTWRLKLVYVMPLVLDLSTICVIPNTSHEILRLLTVRPVPYILKQKAEMLNGEKVFGRTMNKKCLGSKF